MAAAAPGESVVETLSMDGFEGVSFKQPNHNGGCLLLRQPSADEAILKPLRSFGRSLADSIKAIPYLRLQRHPLRVGHALLGYKGLGGVALREG
jgi:hypothetical protein